MFNPTTDPLGIGLKARAANQRRDLEVRNLGHNYGPLSDPAWDGFFQAMNEAGVDNLADNSMGAARGMFSAKPPLPSTFNPAFQTSATMGMTPTNQIGVPGVVPSLEGLFAATRRPRGKK